MKPPIDVSVEKHNIGFISDCIQTLLFHMQPQGCHWQSSSCTGCPCISTTSGECNIDRAFTALSQISERLDDLYGTQENTKRCN